MFIHRDIGVGLLVWKMKECSETGKLYKIIDKVTVEYRTRIDEWKRGRVGACTGIVKGLIKEES
jgi:hypothetical protein